MDYRETLKLLDAGFTKEEILKMAEEAPGEGAAPADDKNGEAPAAAADDKKVSDVSPEIKALSDKIATLNDTVVKLQEANIKNAKTGSAKVGDPVQEQIDSFLKQL